MTFFNELKASLEQAVKISQGELDNVKVTRFEVVDVKAIVRS
jgi:hypothetical protein